MKRAIGNSLTSLPGILLAFGFFAIPLINWTALPESFTSSKWLILHCLAVFSTLTLAFGSEEIHVPKLPRVERSLFFSIAFLSAVGIALFRLGNPEQPVLDRLSFFALFITFFNVLKLQGRAAAHLATALFISTLLVCCHGFYQVLISSENEPLIDLSFASTFGHVNMTAQFVGASILVQASCLCRRNTARLKVFLFLLMSVCFAYLYFLLCRSVLLGVALGLGVSCCFDGKRLKKPLIAAIAISALIVFGLSSFKPVKQLTQTSVTQAKRENVNYRLELWKDSWKMFKERPFLGVGPGNFAFNFVLYNHRPQEQLLDLSPHNEFVRIATEDGIVFLGLLLLFLSLLFWSVGSAPNEAGSFWSSKALVFSLGSFLAVESMFQFPFENAFPFFLGAFLLGLSMSEVYGSERVRFSKKALGAIGLILLSLSIAEGVSLYAESNYPEDQKKLGFACRIFPSNWRVCVDAARAALDAGDPARAERLARQTLKSGKYNYLALQVLALAFFQEEKTEKACHAIWMYDSLFRHESSQHRLLSEYCSPQVLNAIGPFPIADYDRNGL